MANANPNRISSLQLHRSLSGWTVPNARHGTVVSNSNGLEVMAQERFPRFLYCSLVSKKIYLWISEKSSNFKFDQIHIK
jgi:hypothetical protein